MLILVKKSGSLFLIIQQNEKLERIIKYKFSFIRFLDYNYQDLFILEFLLDRL